MGSVGEPRGYAIEWAEREQALDEILNELDQRSRRRRGRRMAVAGGVVAVLLLSAVVTLPRWRQAARQPAPGSALVMQPVTRTLPDGSMVELGEGADMSIRFSAERREIVLHRGVAHFTVTHDESRPFVVHAGRLAVRAVGTQFLVDYERQSAEVLVTEGRVALDGPPAPALDSSPQETQTLTHLDAGQRVVVDLAAAVLRTPAPETVDASGMAQRLAWRVPWLEFSATPLADAVAMFNRASRIQFSLENDALADLKVSGYLRAGNVDTFVRLLEGEFGLVGERVTPEKIVVRRAR